MENRLKKHIIIAGANRSGTTSLFNYLNHHPQIAGAKIKQTNFFLDEESVKSNTITLGHHSGTKGTKSFEDMFDFSKNNVPEYFLEASPDYLYSLGTAKRIKDYFEVKPRFIFILREPNSRLKSWYKFGQQQGQVSKEESYDEYLDKCSQEKFQKIAAYRAINTGHYAHFLKRYYHHFPKDNIKILFFEEIIASPKKQITDILSWLNLSPKPYQEYHFLKFNESRQVKNRLLLNTYRRISKRLKENRVGVRLKNTKIAKSIINSVKQQSFGESVNTTAVSVHTIDFSKENELLQDLVGRRLPWL